MSRLAQCVECGATNPALVDGVPQPCSCCGSRDLVLLTRTGAAKDQSRRLKLGVSIAAAAVALVAGGLLLQMHPAEREANVAPPSSSAFAEWPHSSRSPRMLAIAIGDEDYPTEAIRAGREGTSQTRVVISPAGRVTRCTISLGSGSAVLDRAACEGMAGASFSPGRDDQGRPVPSSVTVPITWRLPR